MKPANPRRILPSLCRLRRCSASRWTTWSAMRISTTGSRKMRVPRKNTITVSSPILRKALSGVWRCLRSSSRRLLRATQPFSGCTSYMPCRSPSLSAWYSIRFGSTRATISDHLCPDVGDFSCNSDHLLAFRDQCDPHLSAWHCRSDHHYPVLLYPKTKHSHAAEKSGRTLRPSPVSAETGLSYAILRFGESGVEPFYGGITQV